MKIIFLVWFIFLVSFSLSAQIREVKSRATSYKYSGSSTTSSDYSNSSSDDDDGSFILELFGNLIFGGIYRGFSSAQYYQLDNARQEDWRISGEFKVNGGVNFGTVNYFDTQSIRGNWGLFSTQVRRMNVNDVSGGFTTLDWQILQLNLINRKNIRWVLGGGISHEVEVNQTHAEWVTELYVSISKYFMPFVTYRKSGDGYPREEFTANMEVRPFRDSINEFSFSAGYLYQRLYGIDFHFPSVGVGFYLK